MRNGQTLWNRNFVAVCFSSCFLFMTFYILAVTLPIFVKNTMKGNEQQIGLVMTCFLIAVVIFRPLSGKWIDELDKKKVIFLSLALFLLSTVMYAGIENYYLLLGLRFLHGIGFGIAATATGAIAVDFIPEERKGEGIGYFSMFMSLAMVVGPFIGLAIMEQYGDFMVFAVSIVIALLSFVCGMMLKIPKNTVKREKEPLSGWKKYVEPGAIPISLVGSILAFSYGAITTFLSVYAESMGIGSYASYFFMIFAAMIVLTRPFTGRIFDRLGEHYLVYPGILLFTLGMIGLSQAQTALALLLTGGIIGLGFGALLPSFQTIAIQSSPSHRRGLATGTYFLLFDTGYGIGSYVLGIVASMTNYHVMYFLSGMIVAGTAVLYYGLHHRKQSLKKNIAQETC